MTILIPSPSAATPALSSETLRKALAEGRGRARERGGRILVSVIEPIQTVDPLHVYAAAHGAERAYWRHHERRTPSPHAQSLAGIGAAHVIEADGPERFRAVAAAWRDLVEGALISTHPGSIPPQGAGPLLLGGFSFDALQPRTPTWEGFHDAGFTLPRFTVAQYGDGCWLTTSAVLYPATDVEALTEQMLRERSELLRNATHHDDTRIEEPEAPVLVDIMPAEDWQSMVARTSAEIRQGHFTKVVLARQARARASGHFDAARTLARLRHGYPDSFHFALTRAGAEGGRTFLGASPERLLRLHDRVVETSSLAGSIRRGATAEEDERLGETLLDSAKDRREHAVVADMLRDALSPVCRDLSIPFPPSLLRLANVQHLYTPIRGTLNNGQTILDLVERLHPTPAVGGFPRMQAMQAIREREQFDRGWYAGPVGWIDRRGEGEFAVAIRSALVDQAGREALLFAGCGIVRDSDPEAEYAESRLKMQAIRSALS
jgi:isochorismate synthase